MRSIGDECFGDEVGEIERCEDEEIMDWREGELSVDVMRSEFFISS